MTRRIALPGAILLAVVALSLCVAWPTRMAWAADEPAPAPVPAPAPAPAEQKSLAQALFDVRHHILMGEFDPLAVVAIKAVLDRKPEAQELISTIEDDPQGYLNRKDTGLYPLLEQSAKRADQPALAKAATDLLNYIAEAVTTLQEDYKAHLREIAKLPEGGRKRDMAKERLIWMAPYSVPTMVNAFMDAQRPQAERDAVMKLLPEMGRPAVEPLCEALQMPGNVSVKVVIVQALAQIGYPHAIPFLQQLAETSNSEQLKTACLQGVRVLSQSPRSIFEGSAGKMFRQLADAYYSDQPSLRPGTKGKLVPAFEWAQAQNGVVYTKVARDTYRYMMAIRSANRSLTLDKNQPDTVALWLAAVIHKDTISPPPAGAMTAEYFAILAGSKVQLLTLSRAMKDDDSTVALAMAQAIDQIGVPKEAADLAGELQVAMLYPDPRVAFGAALAFKPNSAVRLPGTELAVRVLASMLRQTGEKTVVALLPKGAEPSKTLLEQIAAAGYAKENVKVVATRKAALGLVHAENAPIIDLVVIAFNDPEGGLPALAELRTDYRFRSVPTLFVAGSVAAAKEAAKGQSRVDVIGEAAQAAEITKLVSDMLTKAGVVPLNPADAQSFAITAAGVLGTLALEPATAKDVAIAVPDLLKALGDSRPDVAAAVGQTLACIGDDKCQQTLALAALDAKADVKSRAALLDALCASVKRFGNKLGGDQIDALTKLATSGDASLRIPAAKVIGAAGLTIDAIILNPPKPAAAPAAPVAPAAPAAPVAPAVPPAPAP